MLYNASDIKKEYHEKNYHKLTMIDDSTVEYYENTINYNHSFAVGYHQTKCGYTPWKCIVSFNKDGSVNYIDSYYIPNYRSLKK